MDQLIDFIKHKDMYRWYDVEIIAAVTMFCAHRQDLIEYFKTEHLWYKDEILEKLEAK